MMNLDSPTTTICLAQFYGEAQVSCKEFHEPDKEQYSKWIAWIKTTMREHSFIDQGSISLRWGDRQMIGLGFFMDAYLLCHMRENHPTSLAILFDDPSDEERFKAVIAALTDVISDTDHIPVLIRLLYNPRAS